MRPSFAEREAFRSALSEAFAEGRIEEDEFGRRLEAIEQGERVDDLIQALEGLPGADIEVATQHAPIEQTGRHPGRRLGRRAFLGIGAAAGGFLLAGGWRPVVEALPSPGEVVPQAGGKSTRYYEDGGLEDAVKWLSDHHYELFIEVLVYPDMFGVTAVNPERPEVLDRVFKNNTLPWDVEPDGQLDKDAKPFGLDVLNLGAVPEMARVAPEMLGGVRTTHMIFGSSEVRVHVEGDEYDVGGGSVTWSSDATELREVYRNA